MAGGIAEKLETLIGRLTMVWNDAQSMVYLMFSDMLAADHDRSSSIGRVISISPWAGAGLSRSIMGSLRKRWREPSSDVDVDGDFAGHRPPRAAEANSRKGGSVVAAAEVERAQSNDSAAVEIVRLPV